MNHLNQTFLHVIDTAAKRDILASIAAHYGITEHEAYAEVTDEDAEHLLDYLVEPQRGAVSVLMQRYGCR